MEGAAGQFDVFYCYIANSPPNLPASTFSVQLLCNLPCIRVDLGDHMKG
jgi:hypothetical protein